MGVWIDPLVIWLPFTDFDAVWGYTYVFEVELFSGVVNDVTGSRVLPEIDMGAAQNLK